MPIPNGVFWNDDIPKLFEEFKERLFGYGSDKINFTE
jgi:hypothetical protein